MLENCDDAAPLFKFFNKNVSSHSNVALLVQTKTEEMPVNSSCSLKF